MQETTSNAALETEKATNDSGDSAAKTKRKRGSTTTSKPPAKRSNIQLTTQPPHPDTGAHLHEVDTTPDVDSTSLSRRAAYGTRTTNNPHPAKAVGLEKRRQSDIAEVAAARKAGKQAKIDAKEKDQREKTHREREGVIAVAALLDKRRGGQAGEDSLYGSDLSDLPDELQHQISQVALHSEDGDDLLGGEYGRHGIDSGDEDPKGEMRHDVQVGGAGPKKQAPKSKVSISFIQYSHRFIKPTSFGSRRSVRKTSASNVLVRFGLTSTMHALPRETKGFVLRVRYTGLPLPACTYGLL